MFKSDAKKMSVLYAVSCLLCTLCKGTKHLLVVITGYYHDTLGDDIMVNREAIPYYNLGGKS